MEPLWTLFKSGRSESLVQRRTNVSQRVSEATEEDVEKTVQSAKRAFPAWPSVDGKGEMRH